MDLLWLIMAMGIVLSVTLNDCGTCCNPCPSPDTNLEAVYDSFVQCGCYEVISGSIRSARVVSTTGFAGGPVTLTWDAGASAWTAIIGTVTIEFYSDDVCSALVQTEVYDATMFVTCASIGGSPIYSLDVTLIGNNIGNNIIFQAATTVTLDTPIPNSLTCGGPGILGDITISLA